jgi:ribosome-associated protein
LATKKLTTIVIDALEDIKARDIKLINVSKLTSVFDYIAVASADSTRQTKALAKNVMDKVKEHGGWIYGIEGEQSGEWVLVDCGDIVVHIMQPAMRELYELEELWGEGSLEFPKPKPAPKPKVAAVKTVKIKVVAKKKTSSGASTSVKKVVAKKPAVKKPAVKKPAVKKIAAKKPVAKKPVVKKIAAKKPVAKKLAVKKVAVKKPVAKKLVAKKPAAKKPLAKLKKV